MRLKLRPGDFRVRELLRDGLIGKAGDHRVYRVTKRKLTSPEAATVLARESGVEIGQVSMAGLKDRQGVTVQHMSVPRGREVRLEQPELRIESLGFTADPVSSDDSLGNSFEITARALERREVTTLRDALPRLREHGLPNYFDDQRFGNLRHGQGWVARELMLGRPFEALKSVLCGYGRFEREGDVRTKQAFERAFGDWETCLSIARKVGQHRSIFEHLIDHPDDLRGAFRFVATRVRLIHLYAYQSHVWNRAVVALMRERLKIDERVVLASDEGALVCPVDASMLKLPEGATFRLPGVGLEDVKDADQRRLIAGVLKDEGLEPEQFRIDGIEGFHLKGEERQLLIHPRHLRVRPPEEDAEHPGQSLVRLRFELPRGAYATLVVKRLLAPAPDDGRNRADDGRGLPQHGSHERDAEHREGFRGRRDGPGRDRVGRDGGRGGRDERERAGGRGDFRSSGPPRSDRGDDRQRSFGGRDERGPRRDYDDRGGRGGERSRGHDSRGGGDRDRGGRRDSYAGGRSYGGGGDRDRGGRSYGGRDDRGGSYRGRDAGSRGREQRGGGYGGGGDRGGQRRESYGGERNRGRGDDRDRGGRSFGGRSYGGGDSRGGSYRGRDGGGRGRDDRGGDRRDSYGGGRSYGGGGDRERGGRSYGAGDNRNRGGRSYGGGDYRDRERGRQSYGGGDSRGGSYRGRDSGNRGYGNRDSGNRGYGTGRGGSERRDSYGGGRPERDRDSRGDNRGGDSYRGRDSRSSGGGRRDSYGGDRSGRPERDRPDRSERDRPDRSERDRSDRSEREWGPRRASDSNRGGERGYRERRPRRDRDDRDRKRD